MKNASKLGYVQARNKSLENTIKFSRTLINGGGKLKNLSVVIRKSSLLLALPAVLAIRLISPMLLIRIGQTNAGRVGHFAIETELALCAKKIRTKDSMLPIILDLYYINGNISNQYLYEQWKKVIPYFPKWLLQPIHRINQKIPNAGKYNAFAKASDQNMEILDAIEPIIKLEDSDELLAQTILKQIGIEKDDKFVCLCVRDDSYLKETFPTENWDEHNHRDSDVQTYLLAGEALASRGYKVLRMGKITKEKLETDSTSVIDYANSSIRSDMLDVYLFSKAKFIISNATGMDYMGAIFRVPIGLVNTVTSESVKSGRIIRLYQPKTFYDATDGHLLNMVELVKRGFNYSYHASDYLKMNIKMQDNSSEEIMKFALELQELVEREDDVISSDDVKIILRESGSKNSALSKISHEWLKTHQYFFSSAQVAEK